MRNSLRTVLLQSLLFLTPLSYAQTAPLQSLAAGWNLVGNNSPAAIDPVGMFGNLTAPISGTSEQINTVWKWNTTNTNWMFYAPSLDPAGLQAYATSKSYGVLATILSGDGYWVNTKAPLTLTLPSGTAPTTAPSQALVSGWNLVGNNTTAAIDPVTLFGDKSTPLSGISSQIVTVWKWDAANATWMFYAPSLTAAELASYATSKGYGVLTTILPGEGYWVNASAGGLTLALPPVISGVAASGAPIANGDITLTCGDGSTRTTTTDANGAFSVGLANCVAPYVVTATGNIGDAQESLVSVQATPPGTGSASLTVNITPLTHAISASIASSGEPLDLVSNFAAQKSNITDAKAKAAKDTLVAAIANTLTQAGGDPATFDPVGTPFSANRSGVDKLLDNLQIQVNGSGISITSPSAVAAIDDMGNNPAGVGADALGSSAFSAATITIGRSSTAGNVTPLPAGVGLRDKSIGDSIRDALNACFAEPAATRGSLAAGTLSTACQAVPIAGDYLNDGHTAAQEFDQFFTNPKNDNAKFLTPEVIRFFSTSDTDTRALVKFALMRTDGVVKSFATVGEKSTATGGAKKLRGNQRLFRTFVNGYVHKRTQIVTRNQSNPKSTFYVTGINLYFGMVEGGAGGSAAGPAPTDGSRKVAYVKVSGPGLPASGVYLNPLLSGCDSNFAIAAAATTTPQNCTSLYRLSSRGAGAGDSDNFANKYGDGTNPDPAYASTKMSDAQILQIQPLSAYKFEIWKTGNAGATPDYVYIERLRSRPYTMGTSSTAQDGEIDRVRWNTLSLETIAALDPISVPGAAFAGGNPSSFVFKWTNQPNAAPTHNVQVQTRQQTGSQLYQDRTDVRFSATTAALSNGTQGWPDMNSTTSAGNNMAQLVSRNRFDTQLFVDWTY